MEVKAIKAFRIEELQPSVKSSIINKYHNEHYWDWDVYANERNKSFQNICDMLGFQLFSYDNDDDKGYGVGVEAFDPEEVKGASRVIAYINNHVAFKKAMWCMDAKKNAFYEAHADALAKIRYTDWLPTGYTADYCLHEAYDKFIEWVREYHKTNTCTLQDFMYVLEDAFNHELNNDYDYYNSDDYAIKAMDDDWFTEDGKNITALVEE